MQAAAIRKLPLAEITAAASEAGCHPPRLLKLGGPPVVNAAMNTRAPSRSSGCALLAMGIGLVIASRCFRDVRLTLMVLAAIRQRHRPSSASAASLSTPS